MDSKKIYTFAEVLENARKYITNQNDMTLIVKAYEYAKDLHANQFRKSGEPYIFHPIQVAGILVELEMDPNTIAAGFLHDLVEDTDVSLEEIKNFFNETVMHLVDGVTKLGKLRFESKEQAQAENHRKMFVAMTSDFRIILIKLADRLHNMRTLNHLPREKQIRIANETMEIFAPLAQRLGISTIQWELEDTALRYLYPNDYYRIVSLMNLKRDKRREYLDEVMAEIRQTLKEASIEAEVSGRPKHIYSIYRKMVLQGRHFDEIYDLIAVRIIVKSIKDCYEVLGTIHTLWKPISARIKDYIAMPKVNMYQSLHTTVYGPKGTLFEVQIRTEEMHRIAQFGIAAHWAYKQGQSAPQANSAEKRMDILKEFIETQDQDASAEEFMQSLKQDLLADMIYVFTPRGDLFELPKGSIPIDFAYRVHSDVGNKMIGIKINGKIAPLDTPLQTGDIIEVLTNKNSAGPSFDWLKITKSSHTKNKIKQFFKKQNRSVNLEKGRDILEKEIKALDFDIKEVLTSENVKKILDKYNFQNEEDMYAAIGYGGINPSMIATRLTAKLRREREKDKLESKAREASQAKKKTKRIDSGVRVPGIENILIRLSRCCNPVPGDDILGFITKGRGVSIHRSDCTNISEQDKERVIGVEWENSTEKKEYNVDIEIYGFDRPNFLSDILATVSETKTTILSVFGRNDPVKGAVITMTLAITDLEHLEKIINKISMVPDVYEIKRIKS